MTAPKELSTRYRVDRLERVDGVASPTDHLPAPVLRMTGTMVNEEGNAFGTPAEQKSWDFVDMAAARSFFEVDSTVEIVFRKPGAAS